MSKIKTDISIPFNFFDEITEKIAHLKKARKKSTTKLLYGFYSGKIEGFEECLEILK